MLPVKLSPPDNQPLRILCLGAHSDDIEIGCGGTILSLLARHPRAQVRWEVFSGSADREREARSSAAQFLAEAGERTIATHTFRDGFFPHEGAAIKDTFEAIKRTFTPDVVF
ncbi:MAG TPA: PIG-L family deacetylase, partial [Pirellulaceae bacterium]|nr:PIG-L family deacetylase [Pirellulaceae bacterium]